MTLSDLGTGTHYRIQGLTVHDVNGDATKDLGGSAGIQFDVLGTAVKTKFDDVVVDGNEVSQVDRSGINMSSTWKCRPSMGWDGGPRRVENYYPWTNFTVRNNTVHDIGGDGIVMQYTKNGLAEHNVVHDVARRPMKANAGLWVWNADGVTFQYNEVYRVQRLPDNPDGNAFDADYGTENTTFQYNYSHDNAGGMILYCGCNGTATNAVVRYNVSQNDTSRIIAAAGSTGGSFYNNTIYLEPGSTTKVIEKMNTFTDSIALTNNIIVNRGTGGYSWGKDENRKQFVFGNNILAGSHPDGPAGQIVADPKLRGEGTGGLGAGSLGGYRLSGGSPALGAGKIVPGHPDRDFWNAPIPKNCAPDVGAHQLRSGC